MIAQKFIEKFSKVNKSITHAEEIKVIDSKKIHKKKKETFDNINQINKQEEVDHRKREDIVIKSIGRFMRGIATYIYSSEIPITKK